LAGIHSGSDIIEKDGRNIFSMFSFFTGLPPEYSRGLRGRWSYSLEIEKRNV